MRHFYIPFVEEDDISVGKAKCYFPFWHEKETFIVKLRYIEGSTIRIFPYPKSWILV